MKNINEFLSKIGGCSVTQRISMVKQPRGGYINPKAMVGKAIGDGAERLNPDEDLNAGLIGTVVDYLTRFMLGTSVEDAFKISMLGAKIVKEEKKAEELMLGVKALDNASIINAVKLCGFDVCYRAGTMKYKPVDGILPDAASIDNIKIMVKRSLSFYQTYGPVVLDGFTFEGGYTNIVSAGDGDFLTRDTLWDFKVSKSSIKKEHTLQLLMYWRMGLHSIHEEFKTIDFLGIYNPRKNMVFRIATTDIPNDVIKDVERNVIGYVE